MLVARQFRKSLALRNIRKMCDNPIGIKANVYEKLTDSLQYRDGCALINKIANENKHKQFNTAIDIGCGTGNTTVLLQQKLNVNRVFAIDIDSDMISFAKQNNSNDAIEYMVQDISLEWSELNAALKQLENQVTLIFSNHVLHWTERKENVAKNIYRLLAPHGVLYANIYVIVNPFVEMSADDRAMHETKYMCVPKHEQQKQVWADLFDANRLLVRECEHIPDKSLIEFEKFESTIIPMSVTIRRQYIVSKDESERDAISKQLAPFFWDRAYTKCPQIIDEKSGARVVVFPYSYYRFVATKSNV